VESAPLGRENTASCPRPPPFSSDAAELGVIIRENENHQGSSVFLWKRNSKLKRIPFAKAVILQQGCAQAPPGLFDLRGTAHDPSNHPLDLVKFSSSITSRATEDFTFGILTPNVSMIRRTDFPSAWPTADDISDSMERVHPGQYRQHESIVSFWIPICAPGAVPLCNRRNPDHTTPSIHTILKT